MQFLIVTAKKGNTIIKGVPVLVNGVVNGKTGRILMLDEMKMEVSVGMAGAVPTKIVLENTSIGSPMQVTVNVQEVKK